MRTHTHLHNLCQQQILARTGHKTAAHVIRHQLSAASQYVNIHTHTRTQCMCIVWCVHTEMQANTHTRTYKRICRSAVCRRYAREAQHISINARSAKPAAAAAVTPIHGHAHAILRFWAPSAGAVCECACVRVCASVCKCGSVRVAINYYRTILLSRLCACVCVCLLTERCGVGVRTNSSPVRCGGGLNTITDARA